MATTDDRIIDCPHREACGACSLLRQPYEEQLRLKQGVLADALAREVRFDRRRILPTLPSPRVDGYRNRVKMAISTNRERQTSLGYFERRSRNVIDTPNCGVLLPELLETTQSLRRILNSRKDIPYSLRHIDLRCGSDPRAQHLTLVIKGEAVPRLPIEAISRACAHVGGIGVNLSPRSTSQVIKGRIEPVAGFREVYVDCAGLSLRVSPGSFFQVNLGLLPEIHQLMGEFFASGNLLLDLYAGVGTHGFALRRLFNRVICVEGVRASVADAKATIEAGRIDNVEVVATPVKRAIKKVRSGTAEAVILNPSRDGAERAALEAIVASPARSLAYLSCNPATLARDLTVLIRGGFAIVSVQAVDMMPQTSQVEALALLRRRRGR